MKKIIILFSIICMLGLTGCSLIINLSTDEAAVDCTSPFNVPILDCYAFV